MPARYPHVLATIGCICLCSCSPQKTITDPKPTAPTSIVAFNGVLDAPQDGAVVPARFMVGGWAYAKGGSLDEIQLFIDGRQTGNPNFRGARPDVAKAFPNDPEAATSGFTTTVDSAGLNPGKHEIEVKAKLGDGSLRPFGRAVVTLAK